MIINHKYKFIFFKTRKTAGTSIEIALSEYCGDNDIITNIHRDDEIIRRNLGFRGQQNFFVPFKFYKIKNWMNLFFKRSKLKYFHHAPASYTKSYIDRKIWNEYFKFCFERNPFDKAISRYYWNTCEPRPEISDFLKDIPKRKISNWNIYSINNKIAVDFVGRYENLTNDLEYVKNIIGLPGSLKLVNAKGNYRTNRDHYSKFLNTEARKIIEKVCRKEIEYFGYYWQEE